MENSFSLFKSCSTSQIWNQIWIRFKIGLHSKISPHVNTAGSTLALLFWTKCWQIYFCQRSRISIYSEVDCTVSAAATVSSVFAFPWDFRFYHRLQADHLKFPKARDISFSQLSRHWLQLFQTLSSIVSFLVQYDIDIFPRGICVCFTQSNFYMFEDKHCFSLSSSTSRVTYFNEKCSRRQ